MSNTSIPVDSTLLQKYAPTLFAAAITLFGGLQVLTASGYGLVSMLQFAALLVTTVTTFSLRGRWKIALEIVGVVVSAVLPLAIDGSFTKTNVLLILITVTKALATHFGMVLRSDNNVISSIPTVAPAAVFEFQPYEQAPKVAEPPADLEPSTGYVPKHSD